MLVVGNPANTNALLCLKSAPSLPPSNFTCMTRLDQNRAQAQVAARLAITPQEVRNVIIWGNHSSTQFPDVAHAYVEGQGGVQTPVYDAVKDDAWLKGEFITVSAVYLQQPAVLLADQEHITFHLCSELSMSLELAQLPLFHRVCV